MKYDFETIKGFYFKTDHHWNIKGAFPSYGFIIKTIAKDFPDISNDYSELNYEYSCQNSEDYNFIGSWNRKLSMLVSNTGESICYFERRNVRFGWLLFGVFVLLFAGCIGVAFLYLHFQ